MSEPSLLICGLRGENRGETSSLETAPRHPVATVLALRDRSGLTPVFLVVFTGFGAAQCCRPPHQSLRPREAASRISRLDHMERPTSALHSSRVTLDLRQLNAEPHTKEVGHGRV